MGRSANRGWAVFSLVGIALWIGVTVGVAILNDDPSDGRPVLLAFAVGGTAFFATVFGLAWWQTRPRSDPELDALATELSLAPIAGPANAVAIGAMRRTARVYILLGALVTALGLAAIVQEAVGAGSVRATLIALLAIVVAWAAAVPIVLRRARAASRAVLAPLGLEQTGATLTGERHDRPVSIAIGPRGSVTRVESPTEPPPLEGATAIAAWAGRGEERTWDGVAVSYQRGAITVRRDGHEGAAWLWDLWLAERLAG
jgi:hypothetical protein